MTWYQGNILPAEGCDMSGTNVDGWAKWKDLNPDAVPSISATKIVSRPVELPNHWQNLILLQLGSWEWFSVLWSMNNCLNGTLEINRAVSTNRYLSMPPISNGGTHSGAQTILLSVTDWSSPIHVTSHDKIILPNYIVWWFNINIGGKKVLVPQILSIMCPL